MKRLLREVAAPVQLALLALGLASLLLLLFGESPYHVGKALLRGAFASRDDLARTLAGAVPLIFTGLAVAIPFRAGLFNIGAEGQLILAGFAAGVTATVFADLSPIALMPLVMLIAMLVAMIPAGIAGWMRSRIGIHEVIATILLNFIIYSLVMWLLRVESFGLMAGMEPKTAEIPLGIRLGEAIPGTGIGVALVFAVLIAVVAEVVLFRTKPGLMLRARGGNPRAAESVGVRSGRVILGSMLVGGALASFAGTQQVLEVHHSYIEGFSPGYGFTGIAVALLGANRPLGVVLAGLFFAVLRSGAFAMDALAGIPREAVGLLEVLIILLVASELIRGSFRKARAGTAGGVA